MVLARFRALLSFLLFALLSAGALADPPTRVARLAVVNGNASFSPAGEREWGRAIVNRPLTTGDRLWIERASRAELQIGSVAVRAGGATSLTLLNVDDNVTQIQLTRGTLHLRVRSLDRGQIVEVNTANLAFSIRRPGVYRVEVDPREDSTTVAVRQGRARVFGEQRAFVVSEGQSFAFYGGGLEDYDQLALRPLDELDRWAATRERRWETSASRRYVPPQMIGFEDLDQFGTWRTVQQVGPVWVPRRVAADWAPYRDGHWSWIEPWGWTWIDDAPWGFAPSHYGRWMRLDNTWAWVPGPANVRPVYAPALVAFVGGGPSTPNVAWFPLGPRDVYRPAYTTSRDYFITLNASARVERQQVITYYTNPPPRVTYVNQEVPGAIVAVPVTVFTQSQPVARQVVRIDPGAVRAAPVLVAPRVAPQPASIMVSVTVNVGRPPETAPARPIVAQVAPPPPRPSFAARQGALAANAGKPLEPAAVAAIKPAEPASAPAVRVVKETEAVEVPKAPARASSAAAERRARRQRDGDTPAAAAPAAGPASAAPGAAAPASPAASAPERQRERGQRNNDAPAAAPAAPAAAPAPAASRPARPASAAPAAGPSAPAAPATPAAPAASRPARPAPAAPAASPAPAAATPAPAAAAPAPAASDAAPGAQGRQRARQAQEERDERRRGREERQGAPAQQPASAARAPAAQPPAAAASAPAAGEAQGSGASRPAPAERRAARARPAASAASAPADPASAAPRR